MNDVLVVVHDRIENSSVHFAQLTASEADDATIEATSHYRLRKLFFEHEALRRYKNRQSTQKDDMTSL